MVQDLRTRTLQEYGAKSCICQKCGGLIAWYEGKVALYHCMQEVYMQWHSSFYAGHGLLLFHLLGAASSMHASGCTMQLNLFTI